MLVSIPFGFLRTYGPLVWKDIDRYQKLASSGDLAPGDEVYSKSFLYDYGLNQAFTTAEKCPISDCEDIHAGGRQEDRNIPSLVHRYSVALVSRTILLSDTLPLNILYSLIFAAVHTT